MRYARRIIDALDAPVTPEALAAFHKGETQKWWPIIKAANIKAE